MTVMATHHGPFRGDLDPVRIAAYAAATNDTTPTVLAGRAVPATFPVILIFDAQNAANGDVPATVYERARGGVHGEHDIVLHRPLVPGEPIETWSELSAIRTTRAGTRVVLHMEQFDAMGALVVEHWWTTLFLGADGLADAGPEPPDHAFPAEARQHPVGSATQHVDADIAQRYGEVSGDWSAHHFDIAAARAAGFDYLFTHGLCTMAMCTQYAVQLVADSDPSRVGRVAVRFASPTRIGGDLAVDVYAANSTTYAFEASCDGSTVIKHGRLELY